MTARVVVVGTGSIGARHIAVLRGAGVSTAAMPKRAVQAQKLAAMGFEVLPSLTAASTSGIQAVIIASDTKMHLSDTLQAVELGLDALVEKPLTSTLEEALALRAAVHKQQGRVFVGCTLRFSESLQKFRAWLPRLGALHSVRIECQSYLPDWRPARPYLESYSARADEGGVLRDLIHEIDYAGWLFGWPENVQATVRNAGRLGIEADEIADLFWLTSRGTSVSICLDYISRPACRKMTARGENGTLEWDGIQGRIVLEAVDESTEFTATQTRDQMLLAQDLAFLGSADDPYLATLEEAVRAVAICEAARIASVSRREEPVSRFDS